MKVKLDCATATIGFILLFVLEKGVLNASESKIHQETKLIALKK